MEPEPLTPEEKATIKALEKIAKKWPKTLWVYCGSDFYVMKTGT